MNSGHFPKNDDLWCQVILGFYDVVPPTELVLLDIPDQWRLHSSLAKMSIEVNGGFMEAMAH